MVNKRLVYTLTAIIVITIIVLSTVTIVTLITLWNIKKGNPSKNPDSYEQERQMYMQVSKVNNDSEKNEVKKYLFRFWNLFLTDNTDGIQALCGNYTKQIPKSINNFSIDQLYKTTEPLIYFVKTSLNSERYYYTILVKEKRFVIIESNRDEFEAYKKNYDKKYDNYTFESNLYNSTDIDNDVDASFCVNIFINNLKDNVYRAYTELKPAYAQQRFGSFEKFKEYVENNKQTLLNIKVNNSSLSTDQNNIKKYAFYDRYSNVYLIEIDQNNDFYIQLDDYTLDNVIFNAVYENSSAIDKALLNCEKFIKMLNTKDYKAAYSVLDENFKQTYFKTQDDFEKYIKDKIFSYNKAEYEEYRRPIDNVHTLKITLTDATRESKEQREFNVVMMLKEKRNFVMSFEVEE